MTKKERYSNHKNVLYGNIAPLQERVGRPSLGKLYYLLLIGIGVNFYDTICSSEADVAVSTF